MSITGSLMGYENNNDLNSKKNRSLLNTTNSSITKQCPSLNSSIANSVITSSSISTHNVKSHHHQHPHPAAMTQAGGGTMTLNERRSKSRFHLNTLWSIWYGILIALLQGYLAVQGAHRFLVCSMLQWKLNPPSIELNIQIILCGLVFVLLPLFLITSLFKIGNLSNDGIKLGSWTAGRCSAEPHDGLEEEAKGGTLRAMWTHGGPTSAFLHIVTALCLLLPRLLLEARMIENGLLPKEYVWRTELDLISSNKDRLVLLSFVTSPYQNGTYTTSTPRTILDADPFDKTYLIEKFNEDEIESHNFFEKLEIDGVDFDRQSQHSEFVTTIPTTSTTTLASSPPRLREENSHETVHQTHQSGRKAKNRNQNRNRKHGNYRNEDESNYRNNNNNRRANNKSRKEVEMEEEDDTDASLELRPAEKNVPFEKLNSFDVTSPVFEVNRNGRKQYQSVKPRSTASTPVSKDSDIHIVKPQIPENVHFPATQRPADSKIFEIKPNSNKMEPNKRQKRSAFQEDELYNDLVIEPASLISTQPSEEDKNSTQFEEQTMLLALLNKAFGVQSREENPQKWMSLPCLEFFNLIIAVIVWSVRYPSVFWATSKPFSIIFTIQMIANGFGILLDYIGCSVLYKLQIVNQPLPTKSPALLLNGIVTVSLLILSIILTLSSSHILYLYGHGKLSMRIRERKIITMKSSETWTYFAHCASLCFVLALAVVKAPLLHDLSATYRGSLDSSVLFSALTSVSQLFIWIVIWLGLTAKRRWSFKLPPLVTVVNRSNQKQKLMNGISAASEPLLMASQRAAAMPGNCPATGLPPPPPNLLSPVLDPSTGEQIYWPKTTPSSPKLKVTFNEVPSMSPPPPIDPTESGEHGGKRYKGCGAKVCVPGAAGEADDGDYATLRAGPAGDLLHLRDCDMTDDNTSEEGKLLESVRDDSVTYASTRDLEPPIPPPPPPIADHDPNNNSTAIYSTQMISPLAPVTVTVHTNETHIPSTMTPRCLRRADSGVPNEALTPRSDTTSTESSTSPPDRAPSETSSGVHSGEERDEVVIRSRATPYKPIMKPVPVPPIAEEPFGRSTNMRMSSFNNSLTSVNNNPIENKSSATLPLMRSGGVIGDYQPMKEYPHCSTMPLPTTSHQYQIRQHSFTPNSQSKQHLNQLNNNNGSTQSFLPQHTTLPNGVRFTNQLLNRRVPHLSNADSPYGILGLGSGHHTFSKLLHDPLNVIPIPETSCLDTTNYAMIEEEIYITDIGNSDSGYGNRHSFTTEHSYNNNNHQS